jgi:hypothetical protein
MSVVRPSSPVISLRGPHRTRPIRFLELHETAGWSLKIYGITVDGNRPRPALTEAARTLAPWALPNPAVSRDGADLDRYGVGFVIVHDAGDMCLAIYDWWAGEHEIHQQMYSAPLDSPEALKPHPTPALGCVWELAVIDHERRSWVRHILANPAGPDLPAYLNDRFEADL